MHERSSFLKKVGGIGMITMVSRVLGLVREMARAHFLGTSLYSDAFSLAFSLPNLFRRLTAEGAMSNAFIPVFCEVRAKEGTERALAFARNFFWVLTLILVLFVVLFTLSAHFLVEYLFAAGFTGETLEATVFLTRLMFGYILLISLAAILQGILNSFETFAISAITPILLNLFIIGAAFLLSPYSENPATPFAIGVILGGVAQLLFQMPFARAKGFRLLTKIDFKDPHVKESFSLLGPTLFGAGIYQINIIISNLIATTLEEGSLSSLTFSNRLLELVLGVFVISVTTVILPGMADLFVNKKLEKVKGALAENLSLIGFVTLPVTAVTYVMAEEIVALLFMRGKFDETSLIMTVGALRLHMIGLFFIGANRLLLTAYQASKRIKITVKLSFVVMLANLGLCYGLAQFMGHYGIALANSLSQALQTLLLLLLLKELGIHSFLSPELVKGLLRQILLAGALFGLLFYAKEWVLGFEQGYRMNFLWLGLLAPFCFLAPALLLRPPEVAALIRRIRSRKA